MLHNICLNKYTIMYVTSPLQLAILVVKYFPLIDFLLLSKTIEL